MCNLDERKLPEVGDIANYAWYEQGLGTVKNACDRAPTSTVLWLSPVSSPSWHGIYSFIYAHKSEWDALETHHEGRIPFTIMLQWL